MKKSHILASVLALGLMAAPLATQAHHAVQAQFDVNQVFTFQGKLKGVDWHNPHAWFHFDLLDAAGNAVLKEDGKPVVWSVETVGPNGLRRLGLSDRRLFTPGETFTVKANPDRDTSKTLGFALEFTFPDGRTVTIGFVDATGNGTAPAA
jgi:hypothetical protein